MSITVKEEHLLDLFEEALNHLENWRPYTDDVIAKIELVLKLSGRLERDDA